MPGQAIGSRTVPLPVPAEETNTRGEVARLRKVIAQLEGDIEALNDSVLAQESFLMMGYIVLVRPDVDGGYLADCPTLHAVSEGDSFDDVIVNIRDAMMVAIEGREHFGTPIPPRDTDAKCRD